jgi:hypothetical protein
MKRFLPSIAGIASGAALLALSGVLLQTHLTAIRDVRHVALPLAAELPPLEIRAKLLQDQSELAELNAATRSDSPSEKLRVYVLPQNDDVTRALAFFDVVRDYLSQKKVLRDMDRIGVGDAGAVEGQPTLTARALTLELSLRPEGMQAFFALLRLSGTVTVGDTLSQEDLRKLFEMTEAENYAGIVPVEKFLSADLLSYAREPKPYEQELTQAFPSEQFLRAFHALLETSGLKDAQAFLSGGVGKTLVSQKLWPMQFLQPVSIATEEQADGWLHATVEVRLYAREKASAS